MISYYSHGYCHEYFPGTITSRTFVSRASGFISFVPPRGQRIERKRKRERERERERERWDDFYQVPLLPQKFQRDSASFWFRAIRAEDTRPKQTNKNKRGPGYLLFSTFTMNPGWRPVCRSVPRPAGAHHRGITRMWQICQTSSLRGVPRRIEFFIHPVFSPPRWNRAIVFAVAILSSLSMFFLCCWKVWDHFVWLDIFYRFKIQYLIVENI